MLHLHILGVCGTFMAGIAALARALGHDVTGSDEHAWPPMSEQLAALGVEVLSGYEPEHLASRPDRVIIGNALSRGNRAVEHVLDRNMPYTSGPAWLAEHVLEGRWVLAVAGTHGKTTTTALLAWLLEQAGLSPGFLIGGVAENFGLSARLGDSEFFVIEADEYDTAFFDKRSKFVHYRPRTLAINNIEHDHADIFPDIASILRQFHFLLRTVPGSGQVVHPADDERVRRVLEMGCWSERVSFGPGGEWQARLESEDGSAFEVVHRGSPAGEARWPLIGEHNVRNALAAVVAARHAGIPVAQSCAALGSFRSVKRRLERIGLINQIAVYDDFAHHPSAIAATLEALRARLGRQRILAVLEPRSNSMRLGLHRDTLGPALGGADEAWILEPRNLTWDLRRAMASLGPRAHLCGTVEAIIDSLADSARPGDHVVIMSNGDFAGLHPRLLEALEAKHG